jgi:hypothetical protein
LYPSKGPYILAIIHGGKYDSEIIYIDEEEDNEGGYSFKDRLLLPKKSKLFPEEP